MDARERVEEYLREEGHFITEPRKVVIEYLTNLNSPRTVDEIYEELDSDAIDRSSLYRTINLFTELGIVQKVLFRDGITRVELSSEYGGTHHHHLVCQNCERVIEFEECGIDNLHRLAETKHGFRVTSHHMEFYGLCRECIREPAVSESSFSQ